MWLHGHVCTLWARRSAREGQECKGPASIFGTHFPFPPPSLRAGEKSSTASEAADQVLSKEQLGWLISFLQNVQVFRGDHTSNLWHFSCSTLTIQISGDPPHTHPLKVCNGPRLPASLTG